MQFVLNVKEDAENYVEYADQGSKQVCRKLWAVLIVAIPVTELGGADLAIFGTVATALSALWQKLIITIKKSDYCGDFYFCQYDADYRLFVLYRFSQMATNLILVWDSLDLLNDHCFQYFI